MVHHFVVVDINKEVVMVQVVIYLNKKVSMIIQYVVIIEAFVAVVDEDEVEAVAQDNSEEAKMKSLFLNKR
jgi:hypothetical protein